MKNRRKIVLISILAGIVITLLTWPAETFGNEYGRGWPLLWLAGGCGGQSCSSPTFVYQTFLIDVVFWVIVSFILITLFTRIRKRK